MDLIYDGLSTDQLYPDGHKCNNEIKILFLGGYTPAKGQDMLLNAIINLSIEYVKGYRLIF